MAHSAPPTRLVMRAALALSPNVGVLLLPALALAVAAPFVTYRLTTIGFAAAAVALVIVALSIRALAALHARRARSRQSALASLIEHDSAVYFATDKDGVITYQNDASHTRTGSRVGKELSGALTDIFADPQRVLFRLRARADRHGAAQEDIVLRRGHARLSVHQMPDKGHLWRLEEISDRAHPGRGAEGISLPMMTVSKTGTVLFMNDALRRLIGGRAATIDRVFNAMPPRPGEINEIATDDGPVAALLAEIEGPSGRSEYYLLPGSPTGVVDDRLERDFVEDLPIALVKIDTGGRIAMANRQARELLADDLAPGTQLSDLVDGLGRAVPDWLEEAAKGRADGRPEVLRARKPQKDVFLQITLGRIPRGDTRELVAVLNDATELKTLEAQFVQSQKMQAIGQLAGGVAHDFNNLLTAISGHCDLLLLRHDQGDQDYGDLIQINQNANRAASLVGQLLAFSRKQNLQPEIIDLRDSLADLTHLLNRLVGEKVTLTLTHDPSLRPIRADKRQLEQVMMNLVVNARDAMPDGGEIVIETETVWLSDDLQRDRATVPAGEYVLVRVTDQGVGIPSDKLPKIFEPFFTTKRTGEGTGLGLSTVYGIIKQTGGFIFVDSQPGSGTSFSLYFPAHERQTAQEAPKPVIPPRRTVRQGEGVILLVEDEAPVRAFASRALRMRGYTVLEAECAEEALKLLEDASLSVDVFVTDVIMPGLDGPSWVRQALEERPDVRVVFVSGYAEESFTDNQATIPNSVFLPKPFSLNQLTSTVQEQIH